MYHSSPSDLIVTPAELQAVEVHKYYLSLNQKREVPIDEAIRNFRSGYRSAWLAAKIKKDSRDLIAEMTQHQNFLSVSRDASVEFDEAAFDWIARHASAWRYHRESLGQNGFLSMVLFAEGSDESLLHVSADLSTAARQFDADVYLHTSRLADSQFILQDKPYVHVRALTLLSGFRIRRADRLEFMATGVQASAVLDALCRIVCPFFRAA
jgi:hypothetical protein